MYKYNYKKINIVKIYISIADKILNDNKNQYQLDLNYISVKELSQN